MEISLLKALLDNFSRFNNLASCDNDIIKPEPVQKYFQRIDEILKLLRPILDVIVDSQIASNEQLNKVFEELDAHAKEARELVESWNPIASKYYFVMQAESLVTRIRATGLDALQLLNSLHQHLPDDLSSTSIEHSIQKLRCMVYEQTSSVIEEAVRAELEDSTPNSEILVKIADLLSLSTNQELLIEAVALEKVKMQAEQDENDTEVKYIDQMICLVTLMHELLVKVKQSQYTTAVQVPADFCCPLSLELMRDPVILASGQTYERTYIEKWLELGLTVCPKTRQSLLRSNLIPNYTVKALIASWCETNNVEIPDPVKILNLNKTSALLSCADSLPRDIRISTHANNASTRTNLVRPTESTRPTSSQNKNVASSNGVHLERKSLSLGSSDMEDSLNEEAGNGFGLDAGRISLGSSEERDTKMEERNMVTGGQSTGPPKEKYPEAGGSDKPLQGHNRNASVSSSISNTDYTPGTPGDANEASQLSGDLTQYSSNASGELASESPRDSLIQQRGSEFSPRLMETRSRSHTIWRRPTERHVPRIVSSSTIDARADLLEIEVQVKKYVEDLRSTSVDLQRAATCELRLLAKHNNPDNRIIIAECGAIELLVGLLLSADQLTQENAVTALLNLSLNDNNKSAIANAEAINPLIHVLVTGSPEAKENSAATLFSLSVIEENKVRIGRSGAIPPLVDLLGNGTPRGKKDAATALFNLSIFHENKTRIVQAGAVRHLVELMEPAAGMVDKAVAVLANLATIPEGRIAIGQAGGIPVLVEVVELGSARGKENAAAALLQLCTNSSRFCNMVLQEGAVPPLVALSQSGTPRAKEKAHSLLTYFRSQRHGGGGRG